MELFHATVLNNLIISNITTAILQDYNMKIVHLGLKNIFFN